MRKHVCAALVVLSSLSCLRHRPYYRDVVERAGATYELQAKELVDGRSVELQVVDPDSKQPLEGVTLSFGDGRKRVSLKSDSGGRLMLPLSRSLAKENPLVEVHRAAGGGYVLMPALASAGTVPAALPAAAPDAGS